NVLEEYILNKSGQKLKLLTTGLSVGNKIGSGKSKVIMSVKDIEKFKEGEVLVTEMTDPDWVPVMKIASAIVTNRGGRVCHAAIVGRELGVPVIVGTKNATNKIKNGKDITVSCAEGEEGNVYEGIIPFEIKKTDISNVAKTKTKIMMNLGEPDQALSLSFIPNDGVGLAREEFIIANYIKIHPLALINFENLNSTLKNRINKLTLGYQDKVQFYVDKLSEGIGKIGAAFYPKKVIVRFSDFKTNEYRSLVGGELYEPKEENPMLGFRGACRYYNEKFKEAFILECKAIKKVREDFGLDNIAVMVPFCRTVDEGKKVLAIIEEQGLRKQGDHNGGGVNLKPLKVYVMAEVPSNIILAEQFLEIFDGFSIGSNDLTQFTLGLDRDNSEIAAIGNEKNEAVKELIEEAIKVCQNNNKYIGICGDAPSTFPDFTEFLVEKGIESISLSPDAIIKTRLLIAEKEKKINQK
ncbi:MAG: phosphoenolpyruvate synthase, partial [bacterium]|nr:phosphoenolpyruvate synthase [bacterium]